MALHWRFIIGLALWCVAFFGPGVVDAGHPMWEASHAQVKHAMPLNLNDGWVTTWPAGEVKYCWGSDNERDSYHETLMSALNLWSAAALPDRFKFTEISVEECHRNRADSLVLHVRDTLAEYAATVGKSVTNHDVPGDGPIATFPSQEDPLTQKGLRVGWTVTQKFAHAIGHIWGLHHEHQLPWFWDYDTSLPIFTIECHHLIGYPEAAPKQRAGFHEYDRDHGICANQAAAYEAGFLVAAQMVPSLYDLNHIPHSPYPATANDVDFSSIMLYPSYTGTIPGAGLGLRTNAGTLRNGKIKANRSPSRADVQALITLYDLAEDRALNRLYLDRRSEYHTAFERLQQGHACNRVLND